MKTNYLVEIIPTERSGHHSRHSVKTNYLVEQLAVLYGQPKTPDPTAFVATYTNALKGEVEVLKVAADIIARSRKISSWPTIGECLDAVESAKKQIKSRGIGLEPIDNWDRWYGALLAQIKHADSQAEIDEAIGKVRPYAEAQWCFPHRLTDTEKLGADRLAYLRKKNRPADYKMAAAGK